MDNRELCHRCQRTIWHHRISGTTRIRVICVMSAATMVRGVPRYYSGVSYYRVDGTRKPRRESIDGRLLSPNLSTAAAIAVMDSLREYTNAGVMVSN